MEFHPDPVTVPVTAGASLVGCTTPPEQLAALLEAGRKYRSFKYWDKVKVGSSKSHLTGQGFNAVKFDPNRPARTIRRNDGNLGMHGAMYWSERRRFRCRSSGGSHRFPISSHSLGSSTRGSGR